MADPTIAEIKATITNFAKIFWDTRVYVDTQPAQIDVVEQALEGDYIPAGVSTGLNAIRDSMSLDISPDVWRPILNAAWLDFGKLISAPEGEVNVDLITRIKRWMHETGGPLTINMRDITFDATLTAGGGNVGSGAPVRLTVDEEAYPLDACHLDLHTIEFTADGNTGTEPGAEVFEIRGIEKTKGLVGYAGSGFQENFTVHNAGTGPGGSLLGNSSFDQAFGSGTTDKIPRWTLDANHANVAAETTEYYSAAPNAENNYSLVFSGNAELTQTLDEAAITIDPSVPYMLDVPWSKAAAGVTGNLTITVGSKTATVDLSTQANTDWHILRLALDKNTYYRNWKMNAPDVGIAVTNLAVDDIYLDAVIFDQMDFFDGIYHWLPAGTTPFLRRDTFSWQDALAGADGRLAYFFWWCGFGSFPSATGGAETWADPA